MHRYFLFCAILLSLTTIQARPARYFGQCSYTGDPHLAPFPPSPGGVSNMYWCQHTGWEILLQNRWVLIFVKVGSHPYVIVDYTIAFFDGAGGLTCYLFANGGPSTCPIGSGIFSSSEGAGAFNHFYRAPYFLNVNIRSYPYGSGNRYDFYIIQSYNLIRRSTGVCVKFDCSLERVVRRSVAPVAQICDIFVAAAQKRTKNPVDDDTVKSITEACYNDVALTSDPQFAQTAAVLVAYSGIEDVEVEKISDAVAQVEGTINYALDDADADAVVAGIIKKGGCLDPKGCSTANDTRLPEQFKK